MFIGRIIPLVFKIHVGQWWKYHTAGYRQFYSKTTIKIADEQPADTLEAFATEYLQYRWDGNSRHALGSVIGIECINRMGPDSSWSMFRVFQSYPGSRFPFGNF